jgi:hypothetical protein
VSKVGVTVQEDKSEPAHPPHSQSDAEKDAAIPTEDKREPTGIHQVTDPVGQSGSVSHQPGGIGHTITRRPGVTVVTGRSHTTGVRGF